MGTPRTTLYAATAAFAAGIGATVALMSLNVGGPSIPSQATQPAVPSRPVQQVERQWSNPPKPTVSPAATREAQPILKFDDAEETKKLDAGPTKSASVLTTGVQTPQQQDRYSPVIESNLKRPVAEPMTPGRSASTQGRIVLTPSMQDRLDTIRADRSALERARLDRLKTVKVEHNASEAVRSVAARDRIPEARRNLVVDQDSARERVVRRLAAKAPLGERPSLAADKDVRSVVTPMRGFTYAETQRSEAHDRRKRVSSADAGGVMKWLMEPSSNF